MIIEFEKMHGLGNDFIFIDKSKLSEEINFDAETCKFLSERKFGIGCDTIIVYECENESAKAIFINPDGSRAEICVNAARCLGLLLNKKNGLSHFELISCGKTYKIDLEGEIISVDIGKPSFSHEDLGIEDFNIALFDILPHLNLKKTELPIFQKACALSVGNPHLILFMKKPILRRKKEIIGSRLESFPLFKNRINVSFAIITNKNEIELEVFERGVGFTLACGSGACATAFAAYRFGLINNEIKVVQPGGSLDIFIEDNVSIVQKGGAKYVFEGKIEL